MPRFFDLSKLLPESPLRPLLTPFCRLLEFPLGIAQLNQKAKLVDHSNTANFLRQSLEVTGVELQLPLEEEIKALQSMDTPLIVAANHPTGGTDSIALLSFLETVFPQQWKVLSNHFIGQFPALEAQRIVIDPSANASKMNQAALRQALRHLKSGGVLSLFPAGRVSARAADLGYPQLEGLPLDLPWQEHLLRLAQKAQAKILVVHLEAQNSEAFLQIPVAQMLKRTLALVRELARPQSKQIPLRLARLIDVQEQKSLSAKELHHSCYLETWQAPSPFSDSSDSSDSSASLENQESQEPSTQEPVMNPSPPPPSSPEIQQEIAQLAQSQHLIHSQGDYQLFCARGNQLEHLLPELGRARAETFASAGQGTGKAIDLNPEDQHYHHLLLWHQQKQQLAGAYRLGFVEEILQQQGPQGLYLNQVFKIDTNYYKKLGSAVELSRSFVRPAFQRDNQALSILWRGLGQLSSEHEIHNLFGSVTISAAHSELSRGALVQYLQEHRLDEPELTHLVSAPQAFQPPSEGPATYLSLLQGYFPGKRIDELEPWIQRFEAGARGIPPLMRYYDLLGARYSSFQVEASFGNALYNLLRVDLKNMPARYRKRYLGA